MDHDKQITQWIQDPKSFFLAEDIAHDAERPPLYVLEEEFAKTKKNRPYFLYLTMVGVSVVVVGVSLFVARWYREHAVSTEVKVEDFQDLNLKELLENYAKSQDALSQARFELDTLKQEYRDLQAKVRQRKVQEELLLAQQDLTEEEKLKKFAQIATNAMKELKQLEETYLPQIQAKEEEISRLEQESEHYQKEVKGVSRKAPIEDATRQAYEARLKKQQEYFQNQLAEQKRRYEQEKAELKRYYERYNETLIRRYNPLLATPDFEEALRYSVPNRNVLAIWPLVVQKYGIPFSLEEISRQALYQERLLKRLLLVPYTNSVPLTLGQIYAYALGMRAEYESLGRVVGDILEERDQLWKRTLQALTRYVRERGENGLVLSPGKMTLVVMDPVYPVKTGDSGYVFRQDNQMIARVRFVLSNYQTVFIEPVEWYDTKREFQVFDRIVLRLKGEGL
ncbi:MAG: hypothetical protein N2314_02900 [Brevinematales bacterium]|nr:hypothetical protein [Brevinematales bacterium]